MGGVDAATASETASAMPASGLPNLEASSTRNTLGNQRDYFSYPVSPCIEQPIVYPPLHNWVL
jgi:hypothetical protein